MVSRKNLRKVQSKKQALKCLLLLVICGICATTGLLLSQNEIYQDDWYIEASIDGFFGDDNRSLWVIGPNYIITGLIYLLSLTGLRLFWLRIMLIIMNFVSHILISKMLLDKFGNYYGALFSTLFGLVMAPLASFELQFTTTAAYVIASGCAFMFDSLDQKNRKWKLFFSAIWIILGFSLRYDCIIYVIAFMGIVWLYQAILLVRSSKNEEKSLFKRIFSKPILRRFIPFFVTLAICLGIEISQMALMEYYNPGFVDWNSTRTLVDDYTIPYYPDNIEAYKEIGISYNDYLLMSSWNNQDPEHFTTEVYEQILDIKENTTATSSVEPNAIRTVFNFVVNGLSASTKNVAFWIILVLIIAICIYAGTSAFWCSAALGSVAFIFLSYFLHIGRLIWRTEWPIWTALLSALIVLVCGSSKDNTAVKKVQGKLNIKLLAGLLCVVMFFMPFFGSDSLYSKYEARYYNENNTGRYLYSKLTGTPSPNYVTYDRWVAERLSANKDKFYFPLWQYVWLQQYPVYAVDGFRFCEVGAGENWGTLGQYMINFAPIKRNFEKYGINNPFQDLVKDFVRIAARDFENTDRAKELARYLEEHYYDRVSYSVEEIINNTVVGRFIIDPPCEKLTAINGKIDLAYCQGSTISGLDRLVLQELDIPFYDHSNNDEAYIKLTGSMGSEHVFAVMNSDIIQAMIFSDVLLDGESYSVDFIFQHNNKWYTCRNADLLKMPTVIEETNLTKLDLLSGVYNNRAEVTGFYEWESGYAWTAQNCSVKLYDHNIRQAGLLLDLYIPVYAEAISNQKKALPLHIYVNGELVYELPPRSGKYHITIDGKKIASESGRYIVEIISPYSVNQLLELGLRDSRDVSVKVSYIGSADKYPN